MRKLTSHIVEGDTAPQLEISVIDEPSHGGANHEYVIGWGTEGGYTSMRVNFQNGPRINGLTHEALLAIVIDRLECFQSGPFKSDLNQRALDSIKDGLTSLKARTVQRIIRGVEGTNQK